jgi:hypothetical protein
VTRGFTYLDPAMIPMIDRRTSWYFAAALAMIALAAFRIR